MRPVSAAVVVAAGLAAGVALSLFAAAALPAAGDPGLRGALVVLPSVVALLAVVSWRLGARAPRPDEWSLAAAASMFALGGERSGLPASAAIAVLALFAAVGLRLLRLAPALARELGRPRPRWRYFAALPLAGYLLLLPWADAARPPDGDEPYYLLLAESLASDFDVDLADEYAGDSWRRLGDRPLAPQIGDPTGADGALYSRHEPFLPLVLAPFWALGGLPGARLAMTLIAAALAAATAAALAALGVGRRGALRGWALAAFAPPVLLLSHQIWVEVPAALLVALALGALGRARRDGWTPLRAAAFALPLVLLPLLKLRLLAVALPMALIGTGSVGKLGVRRGVRLLAGLAVIGTGLLVLGVNEAIWDNPFRMHSPEELALLEVPGTRFALGGVGLMFDVAFGLCAAAPLWLLVVAGGGELARPRASRTGRTPSGPIALALLALLPYFVAVASRREWYGGWSPAFRYGVVAVPALAALVGLALARRPPPPGRALVAALAALTVLSVAARAAEPGWAYNLADGRSALLDLATAGYSADLGRFTPSATRPRAATWVVPALATFGTLAAFRVGRRRPRSPAVVGVALLLALGAAIAVAAHRLPTRIAEIEDPWVVKTGGGPWPGRWVTDRTRYRGSWMLFDGHRASVPVLAGGRAATIEVRWAPFHRTAAEIQLEVAVGDRSLARWRGATGAGWRTDRVEVADWPAGAPLVLRCLEPSTWPIRAAVVDRVVFDWR